MHYPPVTTVAHGGQMESLWGKRQGSLLSTEHCWPRDACHDRKLEDEHAEMIQSKNQMALDLERLLNQREVSAVIG